MAYIKRNRWVQILLFIAFLPVATVFGVWAANVTQGTLQGLGFQVGAQAASSTTYECVRTIASATDVDDRIPLCPIPNNATVTEVGCLNYGEVFYGTATGTSNTVLDDTGFGENFTTMDIDTSDVIWNLTDGSSCTVTAVTDADTLTCSGGLSGGSDNTFQNGDEYVVMRNDITTTVDFKMTSDNGRPGKTTDTVGDQLTCGLGETTDGTIGGNTALTSQRQLTIDFEVTGSETPTHTLVWLYATIP